MDKRFLEDCLAKSMSLEAIGKQVGKHPSTVSYWLKRHGLVANGAARYGSNECPTADELAALVNEGLTIEGIAGRLGIGGITARKWLKRHGLQTHRSKRRAVRSALIESGRRDVEAACPNHGMTRHIVIGSEQRLRCARCNTEAVSRRRRKVKEILVSEAGGKCSVCGYSRHLAALQFHHLDPATKSFGLGVRGITRSIERLREEASKCVLLCANCHAELEVGAIELPVKSEAPMSDSDQ